MSIPALVEAYKIPLAILGGLLVVGGGIYGVTTLGLLADRPEPTANPAVMETVPETADLIVDVNGSAVGDDTAIAVVDGVLNASEAKKPSSYGTIASMAGVGSGLDTEELDRIVAYGTVDPERDPGYVGVLVESGFSEGAFVAAIANGSETDRREYASATVHVVGEGDDETWIGVLAEGRYVVGTERAVTDALDVAADEADPVSGDVLTELDDAGDGSVRFASTVPPGALASNPRLNRPGLPIDVEAISSIRVLAGSMRPAGGNVSLQLRVRTNSTANGETLTQQLEGFLSLRASFAQSQTVRSQLQTVTFEQDGQTVVLDYEGPEDQFVPAFRVLVEEPFGNVGDG